MLLSEHLFYILHNVCREVTNSSLFGRWERKGGMNRQLEGGGWRWLGNGREVPSPVPGVVCHIASVTVSCLAFLIFLQNCYKNWLDMTDGRR